ncbi:MAG: flagellar hook-length control protein FliK [Rhodospirillaceae bacterium]
MDVTGVAQQNSGPFPNGVVSGTDENGSGSGSAGDAFKALLQSSSARLNTSTVGTELSQTLVRSLERPAAEADFKPREPVNSPRDKDDVVDNEPAQRVENERPRDNVDQRDDAGRQDDGDKADPKAAQDDGDTDQDSASTAQEDTGQETESQTAQSDDGDAEGNETTAQDSGETTETETTTATDGEETAEVVVSGQGAETNDIGEALAGALANANAKAGDQKITDPNKQTVKGPEQLVKAPVDPAKDAALEAQNAALANAAKQGKAKATEKGQEAPSKLAQQQAAELARALDPGTRVEVQVRTTTANPAAEAAKNAPQQALNSPTQTQMAVQAGTGADAQPGFAGGKSSQSGFEAGSKNAQANGAANAAQNAAAANAQAAAEGTEGFDAQLAQQLATQANAERAQATRAAELSAARTAAASQQSSGAATQTTQSIDPISQPNAAQQASQTKGAEKVHQPQSVPRQNPEAQQVLDQIKVNINKMVSKDVDRINVQLYPKHLGKIEVRMDVAKDGNVQAAIIADRPETLDMLRNDRSSLERALQEAGLKADSSSLEFSLRGQGGENSTANNANGDGGGNGANGSGSGSGERGGDEDHMDPAVIRAQNAAARGGVDISV